MNFTIAEVIQIVQLARIEKSTSGLAEELEKIEVEVEITESQAVMLLKTLTQIPLSGNIDQLQKRLPLFVGLKAKLMEAMSSLDQVKEESEP